MYYIRLGAMILVSTLLMFGLMYLNTFVMEHVYFSQTRAWMAIVMGAAMAILISIAVLTSSRAQLRDPRVRALADGILRTQMKEIAEMQALILDLEEHPVPADSPVLSAAAP